MFSRDGFLDLQHLVSIKALVLIPNCYVLTPDHFYEVNYDLGGLCLSIVNFLS